MVSTLCLFILLGGGAWAAGKVDSGDVADNSLKSVDLKDGKGVKGADVAPDSLTGGAIDESALNRCQACHDAETLDGKFSGQFQQIKAQEWTPLEFNDGTFEGEPGILCSWQDYANGFNSGEYRRDEDGDVHVRGLVRASDGAVQCGNAVPLDWTIGTLPMGYRPGAHSVFPVLSNKNLGRIDVAPDGDVGINPSLPSFADAEVWVSLDGISFACAPSGVDGCP